MTATAEAADAPSGGVMQRLLDTIERVGNKVPHPVMMFVYLIVLVIVLSQILAWIGVTVTEDIAIPVPIEELRDLANALGGSVVPWDVYTQTEVTLPEYIIETQTIPVRSLIDGAGLQFLATSFVANFAGFGVFAVTLVAMAGVGAAEAAGLMDALIRKLVKVAPRGLIAFFIILVGVLSSIASDAGYLILIPLAAVAFLTLGRHPLAGMAAAYAGVGAIFAVNLLITPIDAMVTEITNEAIGSGAAPLSVTANLWFSIVSSLVMAGVALVVTTRVIEPRLGPYDRAELSGDAPVEELDEAAQQAEARGLKWANRGFLALLLAVALMVAFPNGPLRGPGGSLAPLMDSLIFLISLAFLVGGICYGRGAGTFKNADDVIAGVTKTFAGLAGLILMLLMIAQFIAYFNYSNIPRVLAVQMAHILESANVGVLPLLVAMILAIVVLDFILPGVVPKWAIFAPVFVPIFARLDVPAQTVLAAYRVGDSPVNVITPLMVYLPFIITVAQRYKKDAGVGTILALMLPYVLAILVAWLVLFVAWFVLGLPLGPGYPVAN